MTTTISNADDTIDSRDVIERLEELTAERDAAQDRFDECTEAYSFCNSAGTEEGPEWDELQTARDDLNTWLGENGDELAALQSLAEQGEQYAPDWACGEQLIRDSYFEQAMDEMVADCYELPKDLPFWMTVTYDYDALRQDYTEIDFDGVAYLIR